MRMFTLDARALEYVRAHLSDANTFCTELLSVLEQPGDVFTCAPTETDEARLYNFNWGGLLPSNLDMSRAVDVGGSYMMAVDTLEDEHVALIRAALERDKRAICVVDDVNPRWSDYRAKAEATAFGLGEEVYHALNADASDQLIADTVGMAHTVWHAVTAVCANGLVIDDARDIDVEALRATARTATLITCIAYDGEGFVAWRRSAQA